MKAAAPKLLTCAWGGAPSKAPILMLVSIIYCLYIDATYCYLLHQFAHRPPLQNRPLWGERKGGLRNETLSVLPIQSILVLLCGNALLLFLNRVWRAEKFFVALCNFWRSSVSGIARAALGGKMRVAGQKVMEAEGDSDLLSSHCSPKYFWPKKICKKRESRNCVRRHAPLTMRLRSCGDSELRGLFLHQ